MTFGIASIVCIAAFVICAFALRARMRRLSALCETRTKALLAAELALLAGESVPEVHSLERQIRDASHDATVMKRNATLFRLLWPEDYDRAFYAAQRFIAQSSRMMALSSR